MAQAEDTCLGPNQTAASRDGTDKMKTCDTATTVWPAKDTQKRSGAIDNTLIQAPTHVPREPINVVNRKPWNQ